MLTRRGRRARAASYDLDSAARDEGWLDDARCGLGPERIADRDGVPASAVRAGIDRARGLSDRHSHREP